MRQIILASGSPRRIEMMKAHNIHPIIMAASIEENLPLYHSMTETVTYLALKKAKDVEARWLASLKSQTEDSPSSLDKPPIIIAADTIVYKDEIMGKPKDQRDGLRMLRALSGDFHYVVTGVALVEAGAQNARVFYEITKVFFRPYTDEEVISYLKTDEAYDKAGGYAIQGYFSRYIDHIEGDYDNVVGFPWQRIQEELKYFD
ncbi:MAG: septum formation protein Maf [Firmicutes bacterium]|nr:septum formation protein Maf [Bacillota bacterium]